MRGFGVPPLRPLLLALVLLSVPLAGCVGSGGGGAHLAQAVTPNLTAAPGGAVEFPLLLTNPGKTPINVAVQVKDAANLDVNAKHLASIAVPANGTRGAFLRVGVPADASLGDHAITLHVTSNETDAASTVTVTLHVAQADQVVHAGQTALVLYTGHLDDGTVFATNVGAVANSSLPTTSFYQAPQSFGPAPIATGANGTTIAALRNLIEGLGVGQSATLTLSPGEAFGKATVFQNRSRTTTLQRTIDVQRVLQGPPYQFQGAINQSTRAGDRVYLQYGADRIPFNVTQVNSSWAKLRMDVHVGDNFSVVKAWPNGTVVSQVNDTNVTFRLNPTTAVGQNFTFYPYWPHMSRIVNETNASIVVEHDPPVGFTYQQPTRQGSQRVTVAHLYPDNITLATPNSNPLAGQRVTFDITVVGVR